MSDDLLFRITTLEARVRALEGKLFHIGHLTRAVKETIEIWDGEFTSNEIRDAVYSRQPALKPVEEHHQVSSIFNRLQKQGFITCVELGAGPRPNVYLKSSTPPADSGKPGQKRGNHHARESGFRNMVRAAMNDPDFPTEFTVKDLRAYLASHAPEVRVPYGTWSSSLFHLQRQGELKEVVKETPAGSLKIYARGDVRTSAVGALIREREDMWRELRATIKTERPDFLTRLERPDEPDPAPEIPPPPVQRRVYGGFTQRVRKLPKGTCFTYKDIALNPGNQSLLNRLAEAGELEIVKHGRTGIQGWPSVFRKL